VTSVTAYDALVERWEALARRVGLRLRPVPCPGVDRTLLLAEFGPADAPVAHITAGVHGDEPAGPWALYSIVESGLLDPRFGYRIWPCTNPSGNRAGTRTNAEGQDVNRSFSPAALTPESRAIIAETSGRKYAVALDLHEDFEADGFYCYEPVIDGTAPLSHAILTAIESGGFPLQTLDHLFDLGYPSDPEKAAQMRTLERGRVLVNAAAEIRHFAGLPLSLYLLRKAARRYVTMETPRRRPWEDRIAMHRVGVTAALGEAAALFAK
jgi:protein MpaA